MRFGQKTKRQKRRIKEKRRQINHERQFLNGLKSIFGQDHPESDLKKYMNHNPLDVQYGIPLADHKPEGGDWKPIYGSISFPDHDCTPSLLFRIKSFIRSKWHIIFNRS